MKYVKFHIIRSDAEYLREKIETLPLWHLCPGIPAACQVHSRRCLRVREISMHSQSEYSGLIGCTGTQRPCARLSCVSLGQDDVLSECGGARGVDASLFQAPGRLHLTLGTMALMDERERGRAGEALVGAVSSVVLCVPLSLHLFVLCREIPLSIW